MWITHFSFNTLTSQGPQQTRERPRVGIHGLGGQRSSEEGATAECVLWGSFWAHLEFLSACFVCVSQWFAQKGKLAAPLRSDSEE